MISTANKFALTCWYKVPCCDKKFKALLFDISNGRATFLTESGQFLTDRIEYITVDGAARMDGKDAHDAERAGQDGRSNGLHAEPMAQRRERTAHEYNAQSRRRDRAKRL